MDLRIVTLDHPQSLAKREPPKTKRELDLYSFFLGALATSIVLGLLGGLAIRALVLDDPAQASEPQQMTSKLETHAIATVSLLDTVKIDQPEQVSRRWDVPLTGEEMTALLEACEAGHIDPEIALGLIQVESNFRADAMNPRSGCYGYCQLNPRYFPSDLSPADNVRVGIEYLAYQLERYGGDLEAALTAYNAGHDTGDRTYANRVLEAAASFSEGR